MSEVETQAEQPDISQDMELVADTANRLVREHLGFGQLVSSMLASRQLYAMCLYELEWLVREGDTRLEGLPELTEPQQAMLKEILINAAAVQAQQPFDEKVLFEGMTNTVFPWMSKVVEKHSEYQQKLRKQVFEEQEQLRIATPVDLGVSISEEPLSRQQAVLLVGEEHVLAWLTGRMLEHLMQDERIRQVVQLTVRKPDPAHTRVVSLAGPNWAKCCNTAKSFERLYWDQIMTVVSDPVDVLLVHDLTHAYSEISFSSLTTRANEAQRKLIRWSHAAGALLVGCLPLDRPLRANELHQTEYETLRMHNVLRGVAAVPVPDSTEVDILVGTATVARIEAAELEALKQSKIVLP
jgi:hypothetical protein